MKELRGNLWDYTDDGAIVITTNGAINQKGECVMGRGVALQAKNRYPGFATLLGNQIKLAGNHVHYFDVPVPPHFRDDQIITFPVKHHWQEQADVALIAQSVMELVNRVDIFDIKHVYLPHPGCANGGLKWENVRPLLTPYLDDRFTIVDRNG